MPSKIEKWFKDNIVPILISVGALLAAILSWGAYKRETGKLKDSIKIEQTKTKVAQLTEQLKSNLEKDKFLGEEDRKIAKDLVAAKKEVIDIRDGVKERTDVQVVLRFNELYPSDKYRVIKRSGRANSN